MEPRELESIIRQAQQLVRRYEESSQRIDVQHQSLMTAIERLDTTLTSINDLLQRG